ncbi:AVAST type 2 anti-phage system protein Avs2 [Planctomicrobium sp. SH527]|uniref:AVAST type 2 anti-phage system protein Avs2 n=1 Tax=Planctomicrobium sp. SH527 TaxID=3448123 RepID=UPI003F5B90DB
MDNHPNLTRYVICLPQNLPDDRKPNRKSSAQKWEERCAEWQARAAAAGRKIEIVLWDETQLVERITKPEHQGKHWFWFDSEQRLTHHWFQDRLDEAIANAGDRYTPKAHVELPIAQIFDGLGRRPKFFQRFEELIASVHEKHRRLDRGADKGILAADYTLLGDQLSDLSVSLHTLLPNESGSGAAPLPLCLEKVSDLAEKLASLSEDISDKLQEMAAKVEANLPEAKRKSFYRNEEVENLRGASYRLREMRAVLYDISGFADTDESRLANIPALLLTGHAGLGKTHLLCDIAERGLLQGQPHLLLHGAHFNDNEPLQQIVNQLGLNCTVEQFLGGLTAAAQAYKSRVLIFIDAINEGSGNGLWKKHLLGFLARLRNYPWIGVCLSVRTTYEDLVVPKPIPEGILIEVEHRGFEENEAEAVHRFFTEYGIAPTFPLLSPEFSRPLFLKLFCSAIKNIGLNQVPPRIRGISALLELFLDSVNQKLSAPQCLDFNKHDRIVHRAVEKLCVEFATSENEFVQRAKAEACVNSVLPASGHSKSLFAHLEHEGVISVDRWRTAEGFQEVVHFAYQRFTDHLVSKYLLDQYLDSKNPARSFKKQGKIGRLFKCEADGRRWSGLLEAMSVQLPERTGKEFFELVPHLSGTSVVRQAFVESFAWRDKKAFSAESNKYINNVVLRHYDTRYEFWNALLMIAAIPDHAYNADWLHKILMGYSLPDRDAWWSIFLHNQWGEVGPVIRLIDWAWADSNKNCFSDEVIRLGGTALAWFLTSSNRFLRDRATKAMVRLLENRISVVARLLEDFADVDDPYVKERLFAVAYGVSMRCSDGTAVGMLAERVYDRVFRNRKNIPVHVRTRDYARGVVERGLVLNPTLPVDVKKIRPPYGTPWPKKKPKTESALRRRMATKTPSNANQAIEHLVGSITSDFEDFCKYIISSFSEWSNVPLGQDQHPTRRERFEAYRKSLTNRQRAALDAFTDLKTSDAERSGRVLKREISPEDRKRLGELAEEEFRKCLRKGSKKARLFEAEALPYIENPYGVDRSFDADFATKWILQRVVEIGWTAERFGQFDQRVNSYQYDGRSAHKAERIGKKYQWIAYCELLARIADNFQMRWAVDDEDGFQFQGPWELSHGRDIDPSMLLTSVERDNWRPSSPCWWFPFSPMQWEGGTNHLKWLKDQRDLPDPKALIQVGRDRNATQWLNLNGYYVWEEPAPVKEDRFSTERRQLTYCLRSFLVRRKRSKAFFDWLSEVNLYGPLLDYPSSEYRLFLGEFYWSYAYQSQDNEYHGRDGWTKGRLDRMPSEIACTVERYLRESSTEDCSVDDTVLIDLPCKQIVEGMGLSWGGKNSEYVDRLGHVIAFDPSVTERGPEALLIHRNKFLEYLQDEGLEVFWTISGEKHRIGGSHRHEDYLGHMEIGGYYRIVDGEICGQIHSKFKSPSNRS